jgi:hypothetical protein
MMMLMLMRMMMMSMRMMMMSMVMMMSGLTRQWGCGGRGGGERLLGLDGAPASPHCM